MTFGREKTSFSAKQFPEERKQGWGDGHLLNHPVRLGVRVGGGGFFQNTHSGSSPPENEMQPFGDGGRGGTNTHVFKKLLQKIYRLFCMHDHSATSELTTSDAV